MNSKRLMAHIFAEDENVLIVAMDHAILEDPMPGLIDPGETLRSVMLGGADAVMTTLGVAGRFHAELKGAGLPLRMDEGVTSYGDLGKIQPIYTIEDALHIGADGVAAMGRNVWQHDNPERFFRALSAIIHAGIDVGMALKELS